MKNVNTVRKAREPIAKEPEGRQAAGTRVGHGGVIDLQAYTAPAELQLDHMRDYLGYLVRRLDNRIYASFLDALGQEDITPSRFTALSIIGRNPGVRQVDIARALEVARPAALKVVNHLIALGLVEAHPIPSDKRIGALALSAKGHGKLAEFEEAVRQHEARIFGGLSAADRAALARLLGRLVER